MRFPLLLAVVLGRSLLATPAEASDAAELALSLVNAERAERGLEALEMSPRLTRAATAHAEDMLARDYYAHVTPEGDTVRDRVIAAGGSRWSFVAENLAQCRGCGGVGEARVRSFHSGWMQSPGHRENILARGLESFGFGTASGDGTSYAVQVFAGPGTPQHADPGKTPAPASAEDLRQGALDALNADRDADRPRIELSAELSALAEELVRGATFAEDELSLPSDLFGLLPEGAAGWPELSVSASACGGCGEAAVEGDGRFFGERLAPRAQGFSHLGFALGANGEGRKIAVAVFGER